MDISSEILKLKDNISKERIQKRTEYEDKAKSAILANLTSLNHDSFNSILSLMNTDFYGGKINEDRFYPLFSKPQRNMIKTNDIEQIKAFLVTTFEKEDLARVDEVISDLYGIKYGAASLLLYIKDKDRYNVFLPTTVMGLRRVYPEKAQDILYRKPFYTNYLLFNILCNKLKQKYSIEPQELDIVLARAKVLESLSVPQLKEIDSSVYTMEEFINETGFDQKEIDSWLQILRRKRQIIFQGPPGTGKTFVAQRLAKLLVSDTPGFKELAS